MAMKTDSLVDYVLYDINDAWLTLRFVAVKKVSCSKSDEIILTNSVFGMVTSNSTYAGCHCE